MRYLLIPFFASFALTACSEASVTTPSQPSKPIVQPISAENDRNKSCGADTLQHLVGQKETKLHIMRFKGPIRIIKPGMAVTKDYRLDRINFDIDENGLITRISCG